MGYNLFCFTTGYTDRLLTFKDTEEFESKKSNGQLLFKFPLPSSPETANKQGMIHLQDVNELTLGSSLDDFLNKNHEDSPYEVVAIIRYLYTDATHSVHLFADCPVIQKLVDPSYPRTIPDGSIIVRRKDGSGLTIDELFPIFKAITTIEYCQIYDLTKFKSLDIEDLSMLIAYWDTESG